MDVDAAIDRFLDAWPNAEFGPAHIVLSDGNIEPPHIYWCLGLIAGEFQRRGEPYDRRPARIGVGETDARRSRE